MWGMTKTWRFFVFFVCVQRVASNQINEEVLKELLTPEEWYTLMGNLNSDENYTITYPVSMAPLIAPDGATRQHRLNIAAPKLGRNFSLELSSSPRLLANDFVVLETFGNETRPILLNQEDLDCYFRGTQAAVSICHGVRGIVHSSEEEFFLIHPLPKRFHNDTVQPHLLVQKKHDLRRKEARPCSHEKQTFSEDSNQLLESVEESDVDVLEEIRRMTANYTKDNSTKVKIRTRRKREVFLPGQAVFVETAVFVDKDLFDHMKTNFPVDTERELIRFVLAMINAVQLLYHDPSLGRPVNFVLKRLELLREEAAGLLRPPDIDRFLSNFCNWQRARNPAGDREPLHWDHALILTGLDLYVRGKHGKISSQVVGLAPVAGMCTATSSCTVNEGRHFESVYVVAHEIGHNLGMRHDGPSADNDCDPSSYIMSPTLGSGKITWSPCSKRYLQKFLDTPQSRCLLDHGSSAGQLDHSAEGALPGERFDSNQQCMLKYGRGSKHSSQQPLDDVCRDLHCERERYTWTSHPALEGTTCGHNMWCRGGRCSAKATSAGAQQSRPGSAPSTSAATGSAPQRLPVRPQKVDGGWGAWRAWGECASGCLFGEEGRLRAGSAGIAVSDRSCDSPRPEGAGAKCEGPDRKYQTCNAQQCPNVPKLTIREYAEQICTRAKDVDKDLTGIGMQKISSDQEEACLVWCQRRSGGAKSRGWTFPDGTACRPRRQRRDARRPAYCIAGRCEEFVCDPDGEATFAQMPEVCPVEKEDNEITWTTGLRRREGAIRWKSTSGCHYNCISPGSGIRLVMSKKFGKSSIQLCKPDQYACSRVKSPFQHASLICTKYKERVRRLSGLGMQISPALEDPDRPCRVACQDESISHRFYLVNGEDGWFPFGTDCSKSISDKKAYCISGKCLEFGSDDTPLSESEITLPLLSRIRRSVHANNTKVTVKLDQKQLDEIVQNLKKTISGNVQSGGPNFDIDLSNPIHINKDLEDENSSRQFATGTDYTEVEVNYT